MGGLWMMGLGGIAQKAAAGTVPSGQASASVGLVQQVRELEHQVERLSLLNQALWELLRDQLHLDDGQLEARITEVDLRDGVADGRMTTGPVRCPKCQRVSSSKHWKCLYCGIDFQRPIMG